MLLYRLESSTTLDAPWQGVCIHDDHKKPTIELIGIKPTRRSFLGWTGSLLLVTAVPKIIPVKIPKLCRLRIILL